MKRHVYLAAIEDSADALGADVIRVLRALDTEIEISGVGGSQMRAAGVSSGVNTSGLAVLGLFDGLAAYSRVKQAVTSIADDIEARDPDAAILIDSWGVMWRLGRELKGRGLHASRIKLIGPQVWATRPGRARVLAEWFDHLLCIHDFEQPFYEGLSLPTTVIGNPAVGRMEKGDGARFRQALAISTDAPMIGLLPGSRMSELLKVAPALVGAAAKLKNQFPDAVVVCLPAPSVRERVMQLSAHWPFEHMIAPEEQDRSDVMAAMDVALACSGTVTTELAEQGAAVVTGYKLGWTSWVIARAFLLRTKFISLINVAAGQEIIPEFVQTRLTADRVAQAARRLLASPDARKAQIDAQNEAIGRLAGPSGTSSARIAAEKIIELVDANPSQTS